MRFDISMFYKIFNPKLLLIYVCSFFSLYSMDVNKDIEAVFGHRLRLKNMTNSEMVVDVQQLNDDLSKIQWSAVVEPRSSIDIGSIHDEFIRILLNTQKHDLHSDSNTTIDIPIEEIKKYQSIPNSQMLFFTVSPTSKESSFEISHCKKNELANFPNLSSEDLKTHPALRAFPALQKEITDMLMHRMSIDQFKQSNPLEFYRDILNLDSAFCLEDIQIRADRLLQEWNPNFYVEDKEYDSVIKVQSYINEARSFLNGELQPKSCAASSQLLQRTQEPTYPIHLMVHDFPAATDPYDGASTSMDYSTIPTQDAATPIQFNIDEVYFSQLIKRIKKFVSTFEEQKTANLENNYLLLQDVFPLLPPVIPFEELYALIKICIKSFDQQIALPYFDDYTSYVQKQLIEPNSEVNIVGDIHGSIHSLIKIMENTANNIKINSKFVFLGDYTDRGLFGAEVLTILMCFKILNWDNVFLLKGNHECYEMNITGGWPYPDNPGAFKSELEAKYGIEDGNKLLLKFNKLYKRLPPVLYLGTNQETWVQFSHGGFQPSFIAKPFLDDPTTPICPLNFCSGGNLNSYTNGFIWGDFYLKGTQIIQDVSGRGGNFEHIIKNIGNIMSQDPHLIAPECAGIKAIFRGHQHNYCGLKMFPNNINIDSEDKATEYLSRHGLSTERFLSIRGLEPLPWQAVVNEDPTGLFWNSSECKIQISKYIPIFTFSTATEHGCVPETFYGVLQTADDFNNWTLQPIFLN